MKNETQEKSLVNVNDSFFIKIKNIFLRLFKNNKRQEYYTKCKEISKEIDEIIAEEKIQFIDELQKNKQEIDLKLLHIQSEFEAGNITEDQISVEDVGKLRNLYNGQIYELKKSIDENKNKILKLRKIEK